MSDELNKLIEAVEVGNRPSLAAKHLSPVAKWSTEIDLAFRGSLDAAKALHEALLPGWEWGRLVSHGTMVVSTRSGAYKAFSADGDNPARAWLLAILRAYAAQQEPTP